MPKRKETAYQASNRRARERGFSSVYDERQYKKRHREEIESGRPFVQRRTRKGGTTYNPEQAVAFTKAFVSANFTAAGEFSKRLTQDEEGRLRHFAIAYFVDYEGMDQDEAIAAMRDVYGDSGQETKS